MIHVGIIYACTIGNDMHAQINKMLIEGCTAGVFFY